MERQGNGKEQNSMVQICAWKIGQQKALAPIGRKRTEKTSSSKRKRTSPLKKWYIERSDLPWETNQALYYHEMPCQ